MLWRDARSRRFAGFIVGKTRLLGVGDAGAEKEPFITIINLKTGKDEWTAKLPVQPIIGGASIDSTGNILVTLVDGPLMCFENAE